MNQSVSHFHVVFDFVYFVHSTLLIHHFVVNCIIYAFLIAGWDVEMELEMGHRLLDCGPKSSVNYGGIGSGRAGKLSHSPWNSIIRTVSHLQANGIDLLALCGRSLGDGNSISYWGDKWCGTRPLKDSFPRVYAFDDNKLCTVAQHINIEDWSFVLRRPPRGGAKSNQLDELIQVTRDVFLSDSTDA
uniref:RNA-directed DNA polymerase, eukaryota, reverse transcriptase zinc-binding domain protein n=1 Tax=Tanacetum cinerariifolium TaxID=118510 RepID=A0A6L2LQ13_TANCI|nr:RNA-directed DNA polymerase, eukaryota, reverse transcriptase zinc-binding domain protein [Tanacetum cinerariifolium]